MKTYIDIVKKERADSPENNISYFENVAYITVYNDNEIPQEKQNSCEKDHQEDRKISYNDENEENKSTDASKTIEQNRSKTNEQNVSKTIKAGKEKQLITCIENNLNNIPELSLTTTFGRNSAM